MIDLVTLFAIEVYPEEPCEYCEQMSYRGYGICPSCGRELRREEPRIWDKKEEE